ncbi:MAG: hypothetical protein HUU21_16520 [Polyangiaceae bacterium]|nr:hypothetical protein [Polyangiaceae bacterium]
MKSSALFWAMGALAGLAIAGCGSSVGTESSTGGGSGGGNGGGNGSGGGNGGGSGSCGDNAPLCAQSCGSDALLAPECSSDGWVCPEGSINLADCPPGTCVGKPPPCHECQMGAWTCSPSLCIDACPEIMCASCGPNSAPIATPTCSCVCNDAGQFVCKKKPPNPGCCMVDNDCGDFVYVPCVNGVCKSDPLPDGACWADGQCSGGAFCVGEFVCPCGSDCDMADTPGKCLEAP